MIQKELPKQFGLDRSYDLHQENERDQYVDKYERKGKARNFSMKHVDQRDHHGDKDA